MSILEGEQTDYFWRIYLSEGVYDGANSTENHFGSSNGGRSLIGRIGLRKICGDGKAGTRFQRRSNTSAERDERMERKKYFVKGEKPHIRPFCLKTNMDTMSDLK